MPTLRTAHTADLDAPALNAIRSLLHAVFPDDLDESDVEHALGGVHALLWEGDALLAHAAVVQRRMLHAGRALRCGYVEGVVVHPDHRRRGHGAAVTAVVERVVRAAYDLGALGSTDAGIPFYTARGWRMWEGPLSALTPAGVVPTPDEAGGVFVLEAAAPLDLAGTLTCDWRDGDVW